MSTTKKRLNITLDPDLEKIISVLAQRDSVPEATKAADLLRNAIELEEDSSLLDLAKERDTKNAKYIKHENFWK